MDNNLSEAVVREKRGYKILLVVLLVVVIGFSAWYFLVSQKNAGDQTVIDNTVTSEPDQSNLTKTLSLEGVITSIDLAKNELTIGDAVIKEVISKGDSDTKVKDRVVKVSEGTVVQKLIVSKDAEGLVDRSGNIEMDINDLQEGDRVSIVYNGLKDDRELNNVQNISLVYTTDKENFETKYQSEFESSNINSDASYMKGKVLSVNGSNIEYSLYAFDKLGTAKYLIVVQPSTKLFAVSDPARVSIDHAKRVTTMDKIKSGSDMFIATKDGIPVTASGEVIEIVVISNE